MDCPLAGWVCYKCKHELGKSLLLSLHLSFPRFRMRIKGLALLRHLCKAKWIHANALSGQSEIHGQLSSQGSEHNPFRCHKGSCNTPRCVCMPQRPNWWTDLKSPWGYRISPVRHPDSMCLNAVQGCMVTSFSWITLTSRSKELQSECVYGCGLLWEQKERWSEPHRPCRDSPWESWAWEKIYVVTI